MGGKGKAWLIGTKTARCGARLPVLAWVVSLGALTAILTGNALPIAGGAVIALVMVVAGQMLAPGPSGRRAQALPGGGHGAFEVGIGRAPHATGQRPGMILGAFFGALSGAFLAAGSEFPGSTSLWSDFHRGAWRENWHLSFRFRTHVCARFGFLHLLPLRAFPRWVLTVTRFEGLDRPLTIVTTDPASGGARYRKDEGDLVEPRIASISRPGLFPSVRFSGGGTDTEQRGGAGRLAAKRAFTGTRATPCVRPPAGWRGRIGCAFGIAPRVIWQRPT